MTTPRKNPLESLLFASFLTLAGGLQDAYSYALRGHVFVNALTGNVVLMALSAVNGDFFMVLRYLRQIAAFALGVYLSGRVAFSERRVFKLKWQERILIFEILVLLLAGTMGPERDWLANFLMAFSCGMQVNTFRRFSDINFATTMCVGNVRTIMHNLAGYHHSGSCHHRKTSRTVFYVVAVFFLGALIGGLFFPILGLKTIWLSALFLTIALILVRFTPVES